MRRGRNAGRAGHRLDDKSAGYAATRPVPYRDILATVYHNLGINPHDFVRDFNDRPVTPLPSDAKVIRELV